MPKHSALSVLAGIVNTDMSGDELIDVVNPATGEVLASLPRSEVHRTGQWHQVFHCLVIRPRARTLVFQQRSLSKSAFPGKLDLSATGHLESGESPIDGRRELSEELGLEVTADDLVPAGIRLLADDNGEGSANRERVSLFFVADETPLHRYEPERSEVDALVEITAEDFLHVLADDRHSADVTRWDLQNEPGAGTIVRDDLVEGTSGYWVVIGVMAQRFLNGERLLSV